MKTKKKSNNRVNTEPVNADNKEPIPNGFFKKGIFSFGLCFSWFITLFCLLFGDAQNGIHTQLAISSFLTGVAFTFALVFKSKINTPFFTFMGSMKHDEHNKNN
jgi:hypothetical protein